MPNVVTLAVIFALSVLSTVALQQASPTKQWPSANVVVVIVALVGAAVLGARWLLSRARTRAVAPARRPADRAE